MKSGTARNGEVILHSWDLMLEADGGLLAAPGAEGAAAGGAGAGAAKRRDAIGVDLLSEDAQRLDAVSLGTSSFSEGNVRSGDVTSNFQNALFIFENRRRTPVRC